MKEVKNKFRERDEIETYFSDVKKKSFPIGIIFILLLIIVIGGCTYYYLVLDSPKNIFLIVLNKLTNNIEIDYTEYEKSNLDFTLDLNLITNKKDYIELTNIINEISISGYTGTNLKTKEASLNILTKYEEKDLFGITGYYNKDIMYIKLLNIFDKVLKYQPTKENTEEMDKIFNVSEENERTKIVIESLKKYLINTLSEANYNKEYIELDGNLSKKITLSIDKKLIEKFYNKLLDDSEFIENYSKLTNITESELKENINNQIEKIKDKTIKISLYVSILKNELIKLEIINEEVRIVINNEQEEIGYKYYENSIIKYQGFISIKEEKLNYQIALSIEDIEEEITFELTSNIICNFDKDIEALDTTNVIDIDLLTESDKNKIIKNITKNETLNKLIADFYSLFIIYSEEEKIIQTT